ncbi:hypothetical protein BEK98_01835 [Streptomyces diastatochromogenes]|uniref:Uncharacterized protein n=1 Tax=Streptomyces diastatochromogenes TaxID=42236 RepID=A0A233SWD5_STRDA|nr:hypothetical protein BEK98_01835 [Streptomyces diastatochromogenes]
MSGFARDPKHYGDRLEDEPLDSKWSCYHAMHCGCGQDWLTAHVIPAGFTVLPRGETGYYGLVGPGLTASVSGHCWTGSMAFVESLHLLNPEAELLVR